MPLETQQPLDRPHIFPPRRDYASLSIKDLLDAREAYHVYLSTVENVLATAVGRYLIHQDDWYADSPPDRPRPRNFARVTSARTLANSVIRPWSWPAVLVFVKKWEKLQNLGDNVVPRNLYLADGRIVPTCVIEAAPDESLPPPVQGPSHVSDLLGGGYSCLRHHQGEDSLGTFACLVRKGGSYYALTNRHVAGGKDEIVRAYIRNSWEPVGVTSDIAVDRQPLSTVFPAWAGSRTLLTLDVGLIRISDITDWTSQVFGIGEIGEIFDATERSVTLDLIGCPVRSFGGSTGVSEGEIRALFFRYESVGGYEHATDVLIGPRRQDDCGRIKNPVVDHPITHPGDSGTLWFYDPPDEEDKPEIDPDLHTAASTAERGVRVRRLRPVAMQWGGERIVLPDRTHSAYALGSFLSTVCRTLDVELVRNWSLGHDEYWGKIGHFAIGWKACDRLAGPLSDLMKANQEQIGFGNETLEQGSEFRVGRKGFVPLADVPDYVWVIAKGTRPYEGIQHFADIDIRDIEGGPSLLSRCVEDPTRMTATTWKEYFDGFAGQGVGPDAGVLPLRIWQIWDAMVSYLKDDKDVLRFVTAAGVLAHYVGDASQPLHCSYLHHGVPPTKKVGRYKYPVLHDSPEYQEYQQTREYKIHGIYEETMLEVDPAGALTGIDQALRGSGKKYKMESGHDAALAVIGLMNDSQERLAPMTIIDADDPEAGPKTRATALWNNSRIRRATIDSIADSVRLLAALWTSAWEVGEGKRIVKSKLVQCDEDDLMAVYRDKRFLPSMSLDEMVKTKKFDPE
jgi:hypothetical protein